VSHLASFMDGAKPGEVTDPAGRKLQLEYQANLNELKRGKSMR